MEKRTGTSVRLLHRSGLNGGTERRVHIHVLLFNMNYQGLVDPMDKPFGKWLPFEVQLKIMFWVECFITIDKRRDVNREIRLLPKCDHTAFPQILDEDLRWNQVVMRWHVPRTTGCHHCHRLLDHNFSVSDDRYGIFC